MCHTLDGAEKLSSIFTPSDSPAIGPDGKPLKTTVCDAILDSVNKAAEIEKMLEKVFYTIFRLKNHINIFYIFY